MASFTKNRFLKSFDQLADFDSVRRKQAVEQILASLTSSDGSTEGKNDSNDQAKSMDLDENDKFKNPLSKYRSYKFTFTVNDHNLLQYTLDRLLKGLTGDRKASRMGFTVALLSVLALHKDKIQWESLILAAIDYTTIQNAAGSEIKDVLCGRLYIFFILQKSGAFCNKEMPHLEKVIDSIWNVYDSKIHYQDASCVLLWLICRDVLRATKDTDLALKYVSKRLSFVLDTDFVEKTLNCAKDTNHSKPGKLLDESKAQIGKMLPGVLPCSLFGLYLRLYDDISFFDRSMLPNTVLNKSPLDESNFCLTLRYVSCIPSNHPVIGSFFDVLIDSILRIDHPNGMLEKLWRSINLSMLDPKGTSSQRHFTGMRLSSYLLLKTRHIPEFLNIYFTAGSNLFVLLSRYHRASKSDMRDMANSVIQLLVNTFQLDDADGASDNFKAQHNPLINDINIYTDINRLIGDSSVYQHPIESSAKPNTQKLYKKGNIEDIHGTNATKPTMIKPLNGKTVMEYMVAIADAMDYTTKSSNVYQHLYKALLHRSDNITEVYENLESLIIDMDVENEERKFCWILNMLQFCLNASNKHERFKLLQRFLTTTLLCVSDIVENGQHLKATISRFIHNDQELRILYISDKPVNDSHSSTSKTNNSGLELQDNRSTKLKSLFKQVVALCLTSISRHLQHVLDRKTEDAKSSNLKDVETNELLTSIEIVYTSLEIVSKVKHVRSIKYDNQSSIPVIELAAKTPQKRRETEKHVPSEIDNLSARLMENGIRMKQLAENTSNMMLITLCSEALGLVLSILSWSTYYMDKIPSSSLGGGESQPLIVIDKIDALLPFAKSFAEAISTKKVTEESVLTSLLSSVLLDTLLIDDNSTVLGLLHSITKCLWKMSSRLATREMYEDILQHSLIEDDFSEQSDDDMENDSPSESDSETEVDVDDSEEDSTESGDSSEDEDSDLEDATSGDDEDEYTEHPDEMPATKKQKMDTSTKLLGDESDLELSGVDALEELLKDEEGNLESLRMARMLQSTGINFSKESFNSMMRNLDLLRSCIPAFTLDEWYVGMVLRLYSSYERSISIRASKTPNDPMYSMLADYTSRIKKVLLEAMQHIASMMRSHQHAVKGEPNSKKPKLADSVEILDNLINLTLQAVRSQRMNIAKECRQVAVAAFVFSVHVESILNGGNVAVQSMMVLLTAICAACMFKNTKFGTNFFVQLSQRHPSAFNRINILKLALESKVSFVQSELLSICSVVVTAANKEEPLKPAKLCRRKCGRILDRILDDGGILKENAIAKQHLVSFITDNIYISTVQTLPDVLASLKANSEAVTMSNVANESGKRPMKNRGISPQLTKAMGRLISNIVRCTTVDTKGKKHLENIKSALQDLLDTLSSSQGKNKQNKALMAAMTQLCRALDE